MALNKLVKKLESEGWIDVNDHKQKYAKEIDELVHHIESALFIAEQKEKNNRPLYDIANTFYLIAERFNFAEKSEEEREIYSQFMTDFFDLKKKNANAPQEYSETMKWSALFGAYAGMAYSYLNGFSGDKMIDTVLLFSIGFGAIGKIAKTLAEGPPHSRGFIELKEQYMEKLLERAYRR